MSESQDSPFNTLIAIIKGRRSTREFNDSPISHSDIRDIVEAGIWAPTSSSMNARHFVVVQDSSQIKKIMIFSPGMFSSPKCMIVLCTDEKKAFEVGGEDGRDKSSLLDSTVAMQNMLLSAESKGIGSCPVLSFNPTATAKIIDLPENIRPDFIVNLGYTSNKPETPVRPKMEEVTFFERYGRKEVQE